MKRTTKLLLGAAFVFGVTGGAFCTASVCLGFRGSDFAQVIQSGRSYGTSRSNSEKFSQLAAGDIEFEQSYRGIDSLTLDISEIECRLIPWEEEKWEVTGYKLPSDFKCRESGGTLKIKSGGGTFPFWHAQQETAWLEIRIPQETVVDGLHIDCGVGDILMEDGMLICREADIDCGVGNCGMRLDVQNELKIECGVGDVSLLLAGAETDFDYKLDCGVGDITVKKGVLMPAGSTDDAEEHDADHEDEHDADDVDEHDADHEDEHDADDVDEHDADHEDEHDADDVDEHDADHEDEHDADDVDEHDADHEADYDVEDGEDYDGDHQEQAAGMARGEAPEVSGAKQKVDHGAGREIKISCGVGSVALSFTENR